MQFSPRTVWCAGFILGLISFAALSSSGANASQESCHKTVGEKQAKRLVWECLLTETSIHAPCNVANPCPVIEGSIKFGCSAIHHALLRDPNLGIVSKDNKVALTLPKFCAKYLAGP
jgi:hypothetical protein